MIWQKALLSVIKFFLVNPLFFFTQNNSLIFATLAIRITSKIEKGVVARSPVLSNLSLIIGKEIVAPGFLVKLGPVETSTESFVPSLTATFAMINDPYNPNAPLFFCKYFPLFEAC